MRIWRKKDLEKHKDARGILVSILPGEVPWKGIRDVMYITGKKGAIRAGHYHDKDTHYCYVLEGKLLYEWNMKHVTGINKKDETKFILLNPGDVVLSEEGELHRFKFLSNGAFIALATQERTQETYEEDTHREDF